MAVSTSCFEQQMRVLADLAQPIRLQDLGSSLLRKERTSAGVAVTFDDGYADNLRTAIPILEKFGIPATFFVVSGYLGREFWWDELDRLDAKDDRAAIDMDLSAAPDDQRRRILNGLARRARWCSPAPLHRALTADELRRAAGSSLIEIGAHGATHRSLPGLSIAEQRREVDGSRRLLEAIVDGPIQSFSYPHGAVTRSTASMVKHAGFSVACCSTPDVVTLRTDVLAVPRFWIPNWGAQRFELFLRRWLLD